MHYSPQKANEDFVAWPLGSIAYVDGRGLRFNVDGRIPWLRLPEDRANMPSSKGEIQHFATRATSYNAQGALDPRNPVIRRLYRRGVEFLSQ
ncbi:hypothetical protein MTO96_015762 [Rhipicephalus appendiculatus]